MHHWANTTNNRTALLNQFLLAVRHKLVWCHRIGGATDEAFQELCFLWERGASVGVLTSRYFPCTRTHTKHFSKGNKLECLETFKRTVMTMKENEWKSIIDEFLKGYELKLKTTAVWCFMIHSHPIDFILSDAVGLLCPLCFSWIVSACGFWIPFSFVFFFF